jgi:acyl carrier protein
VRDVAIEQLRLSSAQTIGSGERLENYGLDSLLALDLRQTLQHVLRIDLPATVVLEYGTIDAIAAYLSQRMGSR